MPIFSGKRLEFVGVKYNQDERKQFEEIGEKTDRPISYVVRELSLRGLVKYLQDGELKPSEEEIKIARNYLADLGNKTEDFKTLEIPLVGETVDVGKRSVQKKKIA